MQVLALVAMEKPISNSSDDIRDEKTRVLRCVLPLSPEHCVLGQYVAMGDESGHGLAHVRGYQVKPSPSAPQEG
jgi:glucose-6-phosphate 1-dehydrogenase